MVIGVSVLVGDSSVPAIVLLADALLLVVNGSVLSALDVDESVNVILALVVISIEDIVADESNQ